jgi:hypothetical protein
LAVDEEDEGSTAPLPAGSKNYITPKGYKRLRQELMELMDHERPTVVEVVHCRIQSQIQWVELEVLVAEEMEDFLIGV